MGALQRSDVPVCPPEIADEVELYARESGRTASPRFVPTLFIGNRIMRGTWVIDFSLRVNDPAMQLWRDGKAEQPPVESIWLHEKNPVAGQLIPGTGGLREPPFDALDIHQLGAAGVRQFLEKGNTWSGRGIFHDLLDAFRKTREHNATVAPKNKADAQEENRHRIKEDIRKYTGAPLIQGGLTTTTKE